MSQYKKTNWKTLYGSSGTQFPDNTTGAITELIMRTFGESIPDSFVNNVDDLQLLTTATGTDTYAVTGGITAYTAGFGIIALFTNANTGAATLNVNSLGAKAIKKSGSTALSAGDIAAGQILFLIYDGTNFQVVGGGSSAGGGTWGSITGTLSSQTDLQTVLDAKVDEETFATLTDGASVTWACDNRQNPLAKLTSTQSFTIDMTNVKSGASGVLKLIKNTASDVILTFDTSFTNKQTNTTLVNYTFSGASGLEYFLSFVAEGTNIEWVIADPVTTTLSVPSWARVRRTTTQSFSNGTLAAISWDTEDADNNTIWTLSPNPTRFVIPGAGSKIVTISAFAAWAGNITGLRRLWIYKNGSSVTGALADQMFTSPVGTETYMQRTFQVEATGGDYLEVMALQVSTTTLNLNSAQCSIKVESL
jgi:hypothetical protein